MNTHGCICCLYVQLYKSSILHYITPVSVRKHASIATVAVMGSRVAGLLREMVFAFFFGAGPVLDAFIAAFRIPNLLRDLFSEGALSNAFVTVFSKKVAKEGDEAAWALARRVMTFVLVLIGAITILGILFSPWIVKVVASGFEGEKFQYTVLLNRLLFPFILFVSLAAVAMGMLNTKGKFALPQSASTFFNLTSILAGLGLAYWMSPETIKSTWLYLIGEGPKIVPSWIEISRAMMGMAIGTLLGGLVQWLIQMPSLIKMGFRPKPNFNFADPGLKQVLSLTAPAIIGGAAVQVNVLVNTNFASYLADGSIAWLNFAFRLMQFPLGVFGVAIALATTPAIARLIAQKDFDSFRKTLRESTQMTLFLCIPSALGLIILAEPILALIYQYGQFTAFDTLQAAHALQAYSVGLVFYAIIKVYQPAFLAFNDARTPMVVSLISIAINATLNWFLVFVLHFEHWGLALGTSCVAAWNGLMLTFLLRRKIKGVWTGAIGAQLIKILVATMIAVLSGWYLYSRLSFAVPMTTVWNKLLLVFAPIGITVLIYLILCNWMGVQEVQLLKEWIKGKGRR